MGLIDIDMESLIPDGLLGVIENAESFAEAILDDLAASALLKWRNLASQQLHTSKADYLDSIQDIEVRTGERVITLVGWLANAIEQGLDSYDLKDILLRGATKRSKDGHRYRPIPFRHAIPGGRGGRRTGQAGPEMGLRYGPVGGASLATPGFLSRGEAAALGKAIHRAAKNLSRQKKGPRGGRPRLAAGTAGVKRLAGWHSTDLYAGLQRGRMQYPSGEQTSGYFTFRMVSENPAIENIGQKWLHPGIQARNLSDEVEKHVQRLVVPAVHKGLEAALKGS